MPRSVVQSMQGVAFAQKSALQNALKVGVGSRKSRWIKKYAVCIGEQWWYDKEESKESKCRYSVYKMMGYEYRDMNTGI